MYFWLFFSEGEVADLIDYLLQFPDQGAAERDPLVGPFFAVPSGLDAALEVLVFADITQNSVTPEPGYWCLIATRAGDALANHANIQLVNNRSALLQGQPSVISSNLPTAHLSVMFSGSSVYIANGLSAA